MKFSTGSNSKISVTVEIAIGACFFFLGGFQRTPIEASFRICLFSVSQMSTALASESD